MLPQRPPSPPKHDVGALGPYTLPEEVDDKIEMPLPSNPQTFFLGSLLALAALAAVYVASSFILPVALAFVLQLILQPAVRLLERVRLPRAVGALFAILVVIGALVGFVAALSVPAATWAGKLPEGIPRLETHMVVLKRPIEVLQRVMQQAEHVADAPGNKDSRSRFAAIPALQAFSLRERVPSSMACLRQFWCFISCWCQARSSYDVSSRSCQILLTNGKPSTQEILRLWCKSRRERPLLKYR
jgi:hypothetical protein